MTAIASPELVSKAARLHVERMTEGRFRVESDSAEVRIVKNTTAGLVCTCASGSVDRQCSHRMAVMFFVEADAAKAPPAAFDLDDFTGAELTAMSLYELGNARNMVTASIAEIGRSLRHQIEQHAENEIAMNKLKILGDLPGYAAARDNFIVSRAVLNSLKNRQGVAKSVMSSLQTAMRSAQMTGG